MEPRTCPKCRKMIPLQEGFKFDGCNLICENCGGVAFEGNIPKKDNPAPVEQKECETQEPTPFFA